MIKLMLHNTYAHKKTPKRLCVQGKLAKSLTLLQGVYASRSFLLISNYNKFSSPLSLSCLCCVSPLSPTYEACVTESVLLTYF